MRLITLNLWGGIVYEPLMEFIKNNAKDTDVFCFQEMLFGDNPQFTPVGKARENLFYEIGKQLPEFTPYKYISPSAHFEYEPIDFGAGQAIFVKNKIKVKNSGGFHCYDTIPVGAVYGGKVTGNILWLDMEEEGKELTIVNLHGLWQQGTSKIDTPERITQSKKIKDFLNTKNGGKILCGDFNLIPNGKSIEILEENMTNLIKKYNIQSTRSTFYKKENKFADYLLVSPDILVKDFKVLPDEVSDHLALSLDFK